MLQKFVRSFYPSVRMKFLFCKVVSETSANLNVTSIVRKLKFVFKENSGFYKRLYLPPFAALECLG